RVLLASQEKRATLAGAETEDPPAILNGALRRSRALSLVGDDSDRHSAKPTVAADQRLTILGLVLIEGACVENPRQQIANVVLLSRLRREQVQQVGGRLTRRSGEVDAARVGRQQADKATQTVEAGRVVRLAEVDGPRDGRVHAGPAEILVTDRLADGSLDQRRPR